MTGRWRCWLAAELAAALLLTGCNLPGDEEPAESAERRPPVVFLVFDEFPTDTLLRPDGSIDAERFPNFAALAESATYQRASREDLASPEVKARVLGELDPATLTRPPIDMSSPVGRAAACPSSCTLAAASPYVFSTYPLSRRESPRSGRTSQLILNQRSASGRNQSAQLRPVRR